MAKAKIDRELFDTLRARGLRKRVARVLAEMPRLDRNGSLPKPARQAIDDIKALAAELEDRISGGPAKRRQAASKAATTRRRNAAKRSEAAKKAARTRAAGSSSRSSRSTSSRSASGRSRTRRTTTRAR